jgi:hypothetical protein
MWMRSSRVVRERLAVNDKVATALGSIPASSDTVEYGGRQMGIKNLKNQKNYPLERLKGSANEGNTISLKTKKETFQIICDYVCLPSLCYLFYALFIQSFFSGSSYFALPLN